MERELRAACLAVGPPLILAVMTPSIDTPAVRLALPADEPFLLTMLFYAAHAHEEPGARPEQLLANPPLARYVVGFGRRAGDLGVVAESGSRALGAAWVRLLAGDERGYGWVDDETPELAIAVSPEAVGRAVGTRMLGELVERARGSTRECR